MKASLGRIIITLGVIASNGTDEHPATITRVWDKRDTSDAPDGVMVNSTVTPDCATHNVLASSIKVYDTREQAQAAQEVINAVGENRKHYAARGLSGPMVAFWPERV